MLRQGWEKILADYIDGQKKKAFVWGRNDCVLFVARALAKITDHDIKSIVRSYGRYNEEQAKKLIKEIGGNDNDISDIFDQHFIRHENRKMTKRGDVCVFLKDGKQVAGIVDTTSRQIAFKSKTGVGYMSLSQAVVCWNIEKGIR